MVHRGVIAAYTLNNPKVIRFEPPLVISKPEIDKVVDAFRGGVAEAVALLGDLI
jgi:putrescine aminotransferase